MDIVAILFREHLSGELLKRHTSFLPHLAALLLRIAHKLALLHVHCARKVFSRALLPRGGVLPALRNPFALICTQRGFTTANSCHGGRDLTLIRQLG